ncbi:MAG: hypothetical protein H8D80_02145 [Proteobacteria bacterium]|nr:hypothetical protein [Pseudomonadota bacterium]
MSLFTNNENISLQVESYIIQNGGEYIDAVLYVCEKENIEPKVAAKYLSKPIIEKIGIEGRSMNLLPKNSAELPL